MKFILNILYGLATLVWVIIVFTYQFSLIYAGFIGIQMHMGTIMGILSIIVLLLFRFPIPIMIGAYFAAHDIWHWEWYWALLFSSPGLLLIAPVMMIALILDWWPYKKKNQ